MTNEGPDPQRTNPSDSGHEAEEEEEGGSRARAAAGREKGLKLTRCPNMARSSGVVASVATNGVRVHYFGLLFWSIVFSFYRLITNISRKCIFKVYSWHFLMSRISSVVGEPLPPIV